jgi:2-oxoglutarate ferredoxin oxidoreductase subunit alpha
LVKGGGHGDYHPIVLAPASVQEAADLTYTAFDLADQYRTSVIIAADGNIGQMMEPVAMPTLRSPDRRDRGWELTGAVGRPRRVITSLGLQPEELEQINRRLQARYAQICANEVRYAERLTEDADIVLVGFGSAARVALTAVKAARARGQRVGLFRPISLWPFPTARLASLAQRVSTFLVVEMNGGQMIEDVRLAVGGQATVDFLGRMGGLVPMPDEILAHFDRRLQRYSPASMADYAPLQLLGAWKDGQL